MSDTVETEEQPQVAPIPNYAATRKTVKWDGVDEEWMEVRFGVNPTDAALPDHVIEVRRTDVSDQWDLAEMADTRLGNEAWLSLAVIALSVRVIDGVPVPAGDVSKAALKRVLKKLGFPGVRAVRRALSELESGSTESNQRAAAGN